MAETSGHIMKARALVALGMPELAETAWLAAAAGEEQTAPRLETLDRDQEAAVHRISAASCYQHAGGTIAGAHPEGGGAVPRGLPGSTGPICERQRGHDAAVREQGRAELTIKEDQQESDARL